MTTATKETRDTDWVFIENLSSGDLGLKCERCGDRYAMRLPCSMDVVLAAMDAYGRAHRYCEPR
jgi:hypothetical protein